MLPPGLHDALHTVAEWLGGDTKMKATPNPCPIVASCAILPYCRDCCDFNCRKSTASSLNPNTGIPSYLQMSRTSKPDQTVDQNGPEGEVYLREEVPACAKGLTNLIDSTNLWIDPGRRRTRAEMAPWRT